eukprot:6528756-Prymnesium_polylepis.3
MSGSGCQSPPALPSRGRITIRSSVTSEAPSRTVSTCARCSSSECRLSSEMASWSALRGAFFGMARVSSALCAPSEASPSYPLSNTAMSSPPATAS